MPVKTEIQYRLCNNTDFPSLSPEYTQRGLNSSLYCPASNNYKIAGNYLAKNYQYVSVNIYRCLGTNCKSKDEINSYLRKIVVSFGILGSYMDINDYENPIKSFFDDTNIYYIDPDFTKEIQIYLKLSEANMDDDYLGVSSQITKQFLDVERVREDLQSPASDSAVIDIGILMDSRRDTYQRTVFKLFDLLGIVGGTYGLLCSSCGLIVGAISTQIMFASVFRRLYLTNTEEIDNIEVEQVNPIAQHPHNIK